MILLVLTSFLTISKPATITAAEVEKPTEEQKNEWVDQFWNWRVAQPPVENGGCIAYGDCTRESNDTKPNRAKLHDFI